MKRRLPAWILTAIFGLTCIVNSYAQDTVNDSAQNKSNSYAQDKDEWLHDKTGIYGVGLGGTQALVYGSGYHYLSRPGFAVNVGGEYKVFKYIGIGWQTGADFLFHSATYQGNYPFTYDAIGVPVILKVNVHILSAIGNLDIADDLDFYAGINIGGGPGYVNNPYSTGSKLFGFFQAGATVGLRYWFTEKIAIFGEFGYGSTFANVGVSF